MSKEDWVFIKPTLITLSIILLSSASIFAASYWYLTASNEQHQQALAEQNQAQSDYDQAVLDHQLINKYRDDFNILKNSGFVGDELRVELVDAVIEKVQALKLPGVEYQVMPQTVYENQDIYSEGMVTINVSTLKLEMQLFHEGDLLTLLYEFEQKVPGVFHVKGCDVKRLAKKFAYYQGQANLNASCQLQWYTINQTNQS